ncbi:hypothetical protein NXS19_003704 [Fusarium pseudograminearum]|nr:hypothetical protein NXS19_003704 [Fusarium pseudograminearum]
MNPLHAPMLWARILFKLYCDYHYYIFLVLRHGAKCLMHTDLGCLAATAKQSVLLRNLQISWHMVKPFLGFGVEFCSSSRYGLLQGVSKRERKKQFGSPPVSNRCPVISPMSDMLCELGSFYPLIRYTVSYNRESWRLNLSRCLRMPTAPLAATVIDQGEGIPTKRPDPHTATNPISSGVWAILCRGVLWLAVYKDSR